MCVRVVVEERGGHKGKVDVVAQTAASDECRFLQRRGVSLAMPDCMTFFDQHCEGCECGRYAYRLFQSCIRVDATLTCIVAVRRWFHGSAGYVFTFNTVYIHTGVRGQRTRCAAGQGAQCTLLARQAGGCEGRFLLPVVSRPSSQLWPLTTTARLSAASPRPLCSQA